MVTVRAKLIKNKREKLPSLGSQAYGLIAETVSRFLADPVAAEATVAQPSSDLPADLVAQIDQVIRFKHGSYRVGLPIQLAYVLVSPTELDATQRQDGGRGCAQKVGMFLQEHHIPAVPDAYQNIGKNTENLARNKFPSFDQVLHWMNKADRKALHAALGYVSARLALLSRPVKRMPQLNRAALTFASVAGLLNELLATPSGGAHEQYGVAAFLDAAIDEAGMGGIGALRVETKPLNASDASAGTAADIQIKRGNRAEEAFEVTANNWTTKVAGIGKTIKNADLQRAHIVACVPGGALTDLSALKDLGIDVAVLDVRALLHTICGILRKPGRAHALGRLYEMLERLQPDLGRVNAYVELLEKHGLVETATSGLPLD
jgi:hypothetical protein